MQNTLKTITLPTCKFGLLPFFFLSLREKSLKILNKILPLRGKY